MDINAYITLSLTLFAIGVLGVLTRRNALLVFMSVELMLNAVNLLLVAFSKMHAAQGIANKSATYASDAQIFVFFIMIVAAAEVCVGLAIIVLMFRNTNNIDVNFLNRLKH